MDDDLKVMCNSILKLASEIVGVPGRFKPNEILATSLAIKIRNSVSCAMKLLDEGFVHDGYVLLRTISEATIYCCEALRNEGFIEEFHKEELKRSKILTNKIIKLQTVRDGEPSREMVKQAENVAKECRGYARDGTDLPELAKANDCLVEYFFFHALGNAYVHSLPNVMSKYVQVDEEKNKVDFEQMPDKDEALEVLLGCVYCLLRIAGSFDAHFGGGRGNELQQIQKDFSAAIDTRLSELKVALGAPQ
jgi:ribosomal protein S8